MSFSPAAGLAILLGLAFGSLASALSYRLPRGLPIATDRSRCPACGTALAARDLVPVLSWILAGGRCRYCKTPLSWRYPAIELVTAALFFVAWHVAAGNALLAVTLGLTAFGLVVIAVADLEAGIIPDLMLLFLLPLAVAWRSATGGDWADGCLGAGFALAISLGLRWAFRRLRGIDALGLGDVKFFAIGGLYLGLSGFGRFLAIGGILGLGLGLVWRALGRGPEFPFAPALCITLAALLIAASPPG